MREEAGGVGTALEAMDGICLLMSTTIMMAPGIFIIIVFNAIYITGTSCSNHLFFFSTVDYIRVGSHVCSMIKTFKI